MKDYAFPQILRSIDRFKSNSKPISTLSSKLLGDLSTLFDREGIAHHQIAVTTRSVGHWHEAQRLYGIAQRLSDEWKKAKAEGR